MLRHYTTKDFFRQIPNALLARYFIDQNLFAGLDFAAMNLKKSVKPLCRARNHPLYSVAKTIADCFKHRNKIGLDVALEALQEGWRSKRIDMNELWHFAKICRVANVMHPYMEAIV